MAQTHQSSLQSLEDAARDLADALKLTAPRGQSEREAVCLAARRAMESPGLLGALLASPEWETHREELGALLAAGSGLSSLHDRHGQALKPEAWDRDLLQTRQILAAKEPQWWRWISREYWRARREAAGLARGRFRWLGGARIELVDAVLEARRQQAVIRTHEPLGQRLFGPRWQGDGSDWAGLSRLATWVQELYGEIGAGKIPQGIVDFLADDPPVGHLDTLGKEVENAMSTHTSTARVIRDRLEASRRELLDLGLRNPLLNYRLLRTRGLEVVDELPSQAYRILVEEGRSMSFLPVAEEEQGELIGQPAEDEDPDQPAARHTDTRLQTELPSPELQARLLSTYHLANSFIQEQGVNTLFLALGMLAWYESDSSQERRHAPLVLVPVALDRSSARHRFQVRHTGDDPGENLSLLEKARSEFGVTLPGLPDPDDLNIESYLNAVTESIADLPAWSVDRNSVVLGFFSFSKFLMYRDLDIDTWPEDAKPTEHPIMGALLDDGFAEPPPAISGDENLDQYLFPSDVHHVVDADGSQTLAIVDVASGRNLVVQGPPGTGKSQTITNMIAEAIGQGRTALFVSEKMAALEVVKRRLDNVGLGDACLELHSHKTTKKAVLDELKRTLELGRPRLGQIERDLDTLGQLRQRLNAYCDAVNSPLGESGVTPYRAYGELILLRQTNKDTALPKLDVPSMQSWSDADFRRKEDLAGELQARLSIMGVPQDHPFWGSRLKVLLPSEQDRLRELLPMAQPSLAELRAAIAGLADAMGLPEAAGPTEAQRYCLAARRAMDAPDLQGADLRSQEWLTGRGELGELLSAGSALAGLRHEYGQVLVPNAWGQDLSDVRQTLEARGHQVWRMLSGEYRRAKARLGNLCRAELPKGIDAQVRLADAVHEAQRLQAVLRQHESLGERLFGSQWRGDDSDWPALTTLAGWVQDLYGAIAYGEIPEGIVDFLAGTPSEVDLQPYLAKVDDAGQVHTQNCGRIVEVLDLDVARRFGAGAGLEDQPFDAQEAALNLWIERIDDVHDILSFNSIAETCRNEALDPMLAVAESWPQAATHLVETLRQAWFESVLEEALRERKALSGFDGSSHRQVLQRFRELDSLVLQHNRARLALAHWDRLPRQEGGGQLGVLRRQFELRRRHLPIRRLMERAGNAVQAIKPVFMMSPLSIATYIAPGSLNFDVVIFDEASQVKPVDAFGAILRADQAVVVGDSKQLPPTNFFDSMAQGGGDDDDSTTADIESVLGLFAAQGAPDRMLRWHYRSRHESLIAVSNQEFYDNSLVVFPSPDAARRDLGLRYHHLPDTVYDRGRSRANRKEAEEVARAVMEHARNRPDLTLGVAAFSSAQMHAVQDQLELLRRQDPSCEGFFTAHPAEPFFVKNLETVQGDERDVIFISIGYGRDADGKADMNFGPLNRDGGERRLNVLITRAKQRCEVFTNLTSDDIDLGRTRARGVRVLKTYLSYARDGVLDVPAESNGESQSPFEEAVALALTRLGHDVRHQIGSAGYWLDLAVVDPDQPGRYLLGIECDGATYHSARSARDRDRLREQVLINKGWRMHRIWSTDWFKHPDRQLKRVEEAIAKAKTLATDGKPAPATSPMIDRDDGSGTVAPDIDTPEYTVAQLQIPIFALGLHELPAPSIGDWVSKVVSVESPVHSIEVARRITYATGVRKVGSRIEQAISAGVRYAIQSGKVRREGEFLWWASMEQPVLRDRSKLPAPSRKLELIAPEEIALAIGRVVTGSYGIGQDEAAVAAARLLGFSRVTAEMRSKLETVIRQMVRNEKLVQQGDQLLMADQEADQEPPVAGREEDTQEPPPTV